MNGDSAYQSLQILVRLQIEFFLILVWLWCRRFRKDSTVKVSVPILYWHGISYNISTSTY